MEDKRFHTCSGLKLRCALPGRSNKAENTEPNNATFLQSVFECQIFTCQLAAVSEEADKHQCQISHCWESRLRFGAETFAHVKEKASLLFASIFRLAHVNQHSSAASLSLLVSVYKQPSPDRLEPAAVLSRLLVCSLR